MTCADLGPLVSLATHARKSCCGNGGVNKFACVRALYAASQLTPETLRFRSSLRGATRTFISVLHSLIPRISAAIMEIDRGDDGDGDTHTGQAPRDRAIPSFASIPPLSPSMEESEDRLDDSRSTQQGCAKCTADGLEVYY
jgi:hypothetical protein